MAVNDVFTYSVSGTGTKEFSLSGGNYGVTVAAGSWGSVALNVLAADGSTYVPFQTWTADAAASFNLVAGSYQFAYSSVTGGSLSIAQQPNANWIPTATLPLPITVTGNQTIYATMPDTTEADVVGDTGSWAYTTNQTGAADSGQAGTGSGDTDSGNTGDSWLYSGSSVTGTSGDVHVQVGQGDSTGDALIEIANTHGGTAGTIRLIGAANSGSAGGDIVVLSGAGTATSGVISFQTADMTAGNSGAISIETGASSSGTRGSITLDGHVVIIANLPTSASGLPTGALYNSSGTLKVA